MKKILIYCVIAFSFWSCKSEIHTGATPKRGFYSDRPAKIWEESLVSGNGIMGAMVIGDPYQESIVLNHALLYLPIHSARKPVGQGKYLGKIQQMLLEDKYMEASQFVVDLANSEGYKGKHATDLFIPAFQFNLLGDTSTVKQYERSVDFTSGEVIVNWEDNNGVFTRKLFVSRPDNLVVLKFSSDEGASINTTLSLSIESGITWENVLTYSKILGEHDFQIMGGTSTIYKSKEYTLASGKGQTYGGNIYHNLASNTKEVMIDSYLNEEKLASFFGRVNYKFMDRYILTASLRADGSSLLADGHKWGYFPSVAVAWRMNEESFLKGFDELSNLKLRLSWGESGQSAIDPYQTVGLLGSSTYSFNNDLASGLYPKTMSNKNLTWETTSVFDLGVDFGFFNNRLSGSVDVYKSYTRNVLMNRKIPSTNGYTEVMENIGKTENFGIDVALNSVNIQKKNFTWTTDFTLSHNKEKIKELASGALRDEANSWFVGEAFQVFYDYKKIGIWQLDEADEAAKNGQKPGDIKIQDTDGNGEITPEDRVIYSKRPKVTFGINNSFTIHDFEFSFFIYSRLGQWIDYEFNRGYKPDGLENSSNVDYWTPENPTNNFPRPNRFYGFGKTRYSSTLKYEKGSFVKVRDVTLAYNIPSKVLASLGLGRARIYATAKNFFTFSSIDNYDPERGGGISFPMTKQLVFGVNLDF